MDHPNPFLGIPKTRPSLKKIAKAALVHFLIGADCGVSVGQEWPSKSQPGKSRGEQKRKAASDAAGLGKRRSSQLPILMAIKSKDVTRLISRALSTAQAEQ
jgi:hypothetical protein